MLKACPVVGKQKSVDICQAFIAGAPREAEGTVFYGVNESNQAEWVQVLKHCQTFYYIDNSYFDAARGRSFRVTRNALQHRGLGTSSLKRLEDMRIKLRPWISDAARPDVAIVLEQSPGFMKVLHGRNGEDVVRIMLAAARRVGLRPHLREWSPDKARLSASLSEQLQETRRVIAFSSAGAITAAIHGVPYCVLDPVCAAARFSTRPDKLAADPVMPNDATRRQWLGVLADNEWTLDEMRSGLAWSMINQQEKTL